MSINFVLIVEGINHKHWSEGLPPEPPLPPLPPLPPDPPLLPPPDPVRPKLCHVQMNECWSGLITVHCNIFEKLINVRTC